MQSKSKKVPSTKYIPEFKGPIEGYVVNFLSREFWRVQSSMERSDAMQEAYIIFARCAERYEVEEAKHFMALFKRSWFNHFTDLANADSGARAVLVPIIGHRDDDGTEMEIREPMGEVENEGVLGIMLRQAPAEILTVLNLLVQAPQEILDLALSSWNPDGKRKGQGSSRLNALLGFDPGYDAVGAVREYFAPAGAA